MAKPNYQYEKRQRELQKKRKKEAKANRKAPPADTADATSGNAPAAGTPSGGQETGSN